MDKLKTSAVFSTYDAMHFFHNTKTAKLKVENSAKSTLRCPLISFCAPSLSRCLDNKRKLFKKLLQKNLLNFKFHVQLLFKKLLLQNLMWLEVPQTVMFGILKSSFWSNFWAVCYFFKKRWRMFCFPGHAQHFKAASTKLQQRILTQHKICGLAMS